MDLQDLWDKALRRTEIIRPRIQPLHFNATTELPYIFLAESTMNSTDTVVRQGEVMVDRPAIYLPPNYPRFEGFDSEEETTVPFQGIAEFLFIRGVRFPSFNFNNKTERLDVEEGKLKDVIENYKKKLEQTEDVSRGLVIGDGDLWQFSILIFIASQVLRSANGDLRRLLDEFRKRDKSG